MNMTANSVFTAMSNPVRLRCLLLLQIEGELCVCELTHALGIQQPVISRHLALLRSNRLVSERRAGQWVYYQVNPELDSWIRQVINTTADSHRQLPPLADDLRTLQTMPDRPASICCDSMSGSVHF
jgi:ArsR family transcriptional regulator